VVSQRQLLVAVQLMYEKLGKEVGQGNRLPAAAPSWRGSAGPGGARGATGLAQSPGGHVPIILIRRF
jgi:hypothetical protein